MQLYAEEREVRGQQSSLANILGADNDVQGRVYAPVPGVTLIHAHMPWFWCLIIIYQPATIHPALQEVARNLNNILLL
ncbi:hypothetical protein CGMCC3_g12901 [Colletotrichum fructicola]|nr:uncharacterized protein CGMCC3_g12901 [Colletotrichum fructicola]KAE9571058.1 hypothetical protein CGMCC3_g12901 [Colletotrichum fructicola]